MKQILFVAAAALLLLTACNNNKKPGITVTSENGKTTTTIDPTSIQETSDAFTKKTEELKKLTPYTVKSITARAIRGGKTFQLFG
jgi:PBP1b-binding outer membrane lipoprotein LpoB